MYTYPVEAKLKINMLKTTKIISTLILTSLFIFNLTFAELNVLWFTKSLDVQVGETFKVDIYVEPEQDHPVVTVSNTLNYDPSKLKFVNAEFPNSWTVLSESPNKITDEANGYLRRTGGIANGINKNIKYITYEFKALEQGNAELFIEDGFALDIENTDIGFENKKMRINILPSTATNTDNITTSTQSSEIAQISPVLDISGKNAIRIGGDYVFKLSADPTSTTTSLSSVKLTLLNNLNKQVYTDTNAFNNSNQKSLSFTIPEMYLREGDYTINLQTNYKTLNSNSSDLVNTVETEKEFGVLESDQTWLDKHKISFFSTLAFIILIAGLYHIHRDHIIFRNLRRKARESHRMHVGHKK